MKDWYEDLREWNIAILKTLHVNNQRVQAVKTVRQWTGCGLKDAIDFIDIVANDPDAIVIEMELVTRYLVELSHVHKVMATISSRVRQIQYDRDSGGSND